MNQSECIGAIRELLAKKPLILDIETTGFRVDAIISLTMCSTDGQILYDEIFFTPQRNEAQHINGITEDQISRGKHLHEEWPKIEKLILDASEVVTFTYNGYDLKVLKSNVPVMNPVVADKVTHNLAKLIYGAMGVSRRGGKISLKDCHLALLGREIVNIHTSSGDCLGTLACMNAVVRGAGGLDETGYTTTDKPDAVPNGLEHVGTFARVIDAKRQHEDTQN